MLTPLFIIVVYVNIKTETKEITKKFKQNFEEKEAVNTTRSGMTKKKLFEKADVRFIGEEVEKPKTEKRLVRMFGAQNLLTIGAF